MRYDIDRLEAKIKEMPVKPSDCLYIDPIEGYSRFEVCLDGWFSRDHIAYLLEAIDSCRMDDNQGE